MSAEFLTTQRRRLDAIGPWTVGADADNLDIKWAAPEALRNPWVPLALRFHTGVDGLPPAPGIYDPDDRMFALYELFASRRDEFLARLREVAEEAGPVERATVEVYRHLDPDEDMCSRDLLVSFRFVLDGGEHWCFSTYDPDTDAFGGLEG